MWSSGNLGDAVGLKTRYSHGYSLHKLGHDSFEYVYCIYIYINHPPPKKVQERGGYAPKLVLFTCFFLGFPREKFIHHVAFAGGGGRWMGWTKAVRTTSPPSLIHFAEVLEFLGFLGVLNPWAFILFTYVLANHSVGIPRIPQCSMNPPVYTFYVRVSIFGYS